MDGAQQPGWKSAAVDQIWPRSFADLSGDPVTVEMPDAARRQDSELVPAGVPEPAAQPRLRPWQARIQRSA